MGRLRGATGKPSCPSEYSSNTQDSHSELELNLKATSGGEVCKTCLDSGWFASQATVIAAAVFLFDSPVQVKMKKEVKEHNI